MPWSGKKTLGLILGIAGAGVIGVAAYAAAKRPPTTYQGTNSQSGQCPQGTVPFKNTTVCPPGWVSVQVGCCAPGTGGSPPNSQPPEGLLLYISTPQVPVGAPTPVSVEGGRSGNRVAIVWSFAPSNDPSSSSIQPLAGGTFDSNGGFSAIITPPAPPMLGAPVFIAALDQVTGVFSAWIPLVVLPPTNQPYVTVGRLPNPAAT